MNVSRCPLDRVEAIANSAATPAAQTPCAHPVRGTVSPVCGTGVSPVSCSSGILPECGTGILPVSAGPRAVTPISVIPARRAQRFLTNFAALAAAVLLAPLPAFAQDEPTLPTPATPAATLAPAAADLSALPDQDMTPGAEVDATFHVLQLIGFDVDGAPEYEGVGTAEAPAEVGIRLRFDACATTGADWFWEFGDGSMAWESGQCWAIKSYGARGTYAVRVTIFDANGVQLGNPLERSIVVGAMTYERSVSVLDPTPPFAVARAAGIGSKMWLISTAGELACADLTDDCPPVVPSFDLGLSGAYQPDVFEGEYVEPPDEPETYLLVPRGVLGLDVIRVDLSPPQRVWTFLPPSSLQSVVGVAVLRESAFLLISYGSAADVFRYPLAELVDVSAEAPHDSMRLPFASVFIRADHENGPLFVASYSYDPVLTMFSTPHRGFQDSLTFVPSGGSGQVLFASASESSIFVYRSGTLSTYSRVSGSLVSSLAFPATFVSSAGNRLLAVNAGTNQLRKIDVADPQQPYVAQVLQASAGSWATASDPFVNQFGIAGTPGGVALFQLR